MLRGGWRASGALAQSEHSHASAPIHCAPPSSISPPIHVRLHFQPSCHFARFIQPTANNGHACMLGGRSEAWLPDRSPLGGNNDTLGVCMGSSGVRPPLVLGCTRDASARRVASRRERGGRGRGRAERWRAE